MLLESLRLKTDNLLRSFRNETEPSVARGRNISETFPSV
jgi:hypothetical protein